MELEGLEGIGGIGGCSHTLDAGEVGGFLVVWLGNSWIVHFINWLSSVSGILGILVFWV